MLNPNLNSNYCLHNRLTCSTLFKGIQNSTCWLRPYANKIEFQLNCVYQPKLPYVWMLRVSGFRADEICPPPFCVHMYIFKEIVFYFKIGNFFTHHNLLLNLFKFKMVSTCYNLKMFLISCKQYTYIHRYSYMVYISHLQLQFDHCIAMEIVHTAFEFLPGSRACI